MAQCPCGSGFDLDDCCDPIISGATPAPTAEALMRSRFTAFFRGDLDHIERTYCREERDKFGRAAAQRSFNAVEWIDLKIFGTSRGGENDDTGKVDFAARFKRDGELLVHRERSTFARENGLWVYVDGDVNPDSAPEAPLRRDVKVGRNQPCPCGSGKKYKKCCGA